MELNRYRVTKDDKGFWTVRAENGSTPPEPHTFSEYSPALRRSDELNQAEQYAIIKAKSAGTWTGFSKNRNRR